MKRELNYNFIQRYNGEGAFTFQISRMIYTQGGLGCMWECRRQGAVTLASQ